MFKPVVFCLVLFIAACHSSIREGEKNKFTIEEAQQIEKEAWDSLPNLLKHITPPNFPQQDIYITDFGARDDFSFDSRPAILQAIASCHDNGGGRVILPFGKYFSDGPIHLKSNVNLHLEEGAILRFGDNSEKYTPLVKVRWEGTVCWNWSPLIYAFRQTNIALTGQGVIDGNGKNWSVSWRKLQNPEKDVLRQMGNDLVPEDQRVFGNGFLDLNKDGKDDGHGDNRMHYLRPTLVEFYESENILIDSLTFKQAPFWTIHPVFSKNVTIKNISVYGDYLNDDGIDPDGCENVLIENCYVQTHDDAIAIKAGRDQDAWNRPKCKNIVIRNCKLASGVNAFAIGSEMSGGVENVFVENCSLLKGKHGLTFKCNLDRGGQVQRIFLRNIEIDTLKEAMFIFRMDYHGYRGNNFPTRFNDFYASHITCNAVEEYAFKIIGVEEQPIERIYLHDINIKKAGLDNIIHHAETLLFDQISINGKLWP